MTRQATPPLLLALTFLGFVSLGLPDAVTGVVWPSAYRHFGVPAGSLGVLLVAATAGYLVSSLLVGSLLQRLGVGGLLAASTALVAASLGGFALAPAWPLFVASGVFIGLGSGAIDAGLNAFAARHFTARHMNWLHACWGAGATLGAAAAAAVVASGVAWRNTYGILGVVMVAMALVFSLSVRLWKDGPGATHAQRAAHGESPATMREALGQPLVWAQIAVFFAYTGIEMTAGQWSFTLLTQHREVPVAAAGTAASAYWASLTAGRFLLGAVVERLGVERLLRLSVTTALLGALTFVLAPWTAVSAAGLALLGFSLAPVYPGLMTQTPGRLGRFADFGVGFQVSAAMLGAVVVPSVGGLILQAFGAAWLNGAVAVLAFVLWLALTALLRPRAT